MKRSIRTILAVAFIMVIGATETMATEEVPFTVLKTSGKYELREYAPHILAEIIVDGELESAGNKAFRPLFRYISGDNRSRSKVAMTAPVSQENAGEKIPMTAPVGQQRSRDKWAVSFMMPASYTLDTLPVPDNPAIVLRQVPSRRVAAVRYSGTWSEKNYQENKLELESWMRDQQLQPAGDAVWARYNPPFTLWFMRRNEILIPVGPAVRHE